MKKEGRNILFNISFEGLTVEIYKEIGEENNVAGVYPFHKIFY